MNNDELYHYGVPGMKWGVRKVRGHAGPGRYLTKKRQEAGDKRDLKRLERGEHLSVGLSKKRQAALDARDKRIIEGRLNKNEQKQAAKSEKKQFKQDVKTARKKGILVDVELDQFNGGLKVSNHKIGNREITPEYADRILRKIRKDNAVRTLAGTTVVLAGSAFVTSLLDR